MSIYYGTDQQNLLGVYYSWNYNWNVLYMYGNNDVVDLPKNENDNILIYCGIGEDAFYGRDGNDTAYGNEDSDYLYGRGGNDRLYGGQGDDHLYGGDGNDYLSGGTFSDLIYGGLGADDLYGGTTGIAAVDHFYFKKGESNAVNGQADTIHDWDTHDEIDLPIVGTRDNFRALATNATSIGAARTQAEHAASLDAKDHVYLYNASTKTGYLLSDLDRNDSFETGVIVKGPDAANVTWYDIG